MTRRLLVLGLVVLATLTLGSVTWTGAIAPQEIVEPNRAALPAAAPAAAVYNWQIRTIDTAGDLLEQPSLALAPVVPYTPSISYYDYASSSLRFATYDGADWITQTVDNTGLTGEQSSLALYPAAPYSPYIAYYSWTGVTGTLKYAYVSGSAWLSQTVDGNHAGYYPSLAFDSSGVPHISYYDWLDRNLKYATRLTTPPYSWVRTVLDSVGDVGEYTSLSASPDDYIRISYYDYTNQDLKYARYYGTSWVTQTIHSAGDVGTHTSIAVDKSRNPHISYCKHDLDGYCLELRYAHYTGTTWISETVPTGSNDMLHTSLQVDSNKRPHIAYIDVNTDKLMYAYFTGSAWITETVDSAETGYPPSLALDGQGRPHISYIYTNGTTWSLRYAVGENTCSTALSGVSLAGPTTGITGTDYSFTGTLSPALATSPFTYTWQSSDFATEALTGTSIQSILSRNWSTVGPKTLVFTGTNCGATFAATHVINISACRAPLTGVSLSGPTVGGTNIAYTFAATASPVAPSTPVTYTWQATGQSTVVQTNAVSQTTKSYTWTTTGTKLITVTAANCGGTFTVSQSFNVVAASELPDLQVPYLWNDGPRVQYTVRNEGANPAGPGHAVAMYMDGVLKERVTLTTTLAQYESAYGYFATPWQCAATDAVIKVCADDTGALSESNEANNCRQETWSCDVTFPTFVKAPQVKFRDARSATIVWQTDEPTRGYLGYGRTPDQDDAGQSDSNYTTQHTLTLTSLLPSTTYHYKVVATDPAGQQIHSAEAFFQTSAVTDTLALVTSASLTEYNSTFYEFYTLKATTQYTDNVRSVRFILDNTYIGEDYSGSPEYKVYLSPYALGLTRDQFFAPHTLKMWAYNLNNLPTLFTQTITPTRPTDDPYDVTIKEPHPGHTVWISGGSTAPAGTTLDVTMRAARFEWDCTWSGFSEGDVVPPGLSAVNCRDVSHSVSRMSILLDDALVEAFTPTGDTVTHTFSVNLAGKSVGAHTLKARAVINGQPADTTRDFTIEVGQPSLTLWREVSRVQNYLKVKLTLRNDGLGEARVDKLVDSVDGLQQVNRDQPSYTMTTSASYWLGAEKRRNQFVLDLRSGSAGEVVIAPGASYSVEYNVAPILYEGAVTPAIGNLAVKVTYTYQGQSIEKEFLRPVSDVRDPGGFDVPLQQALADAVKQADYVIATNPTRLYSYYASSDVTALLATMAHLATLKNGVLGYIKTYQHSTLDNLIEPGHTWAEALNPVFKERDEGYLLIVGETEIVPAHKEKDFAVVWGTELAREPDDVSYSDLVYADTAGETARPELVVGRIVGDCAAKLAKPIQASIDVVYTPSQFDRSHALLVSGRGDYVSDFRDNVNDIANRIDDEFTVTKLHWQDYSGSYFSELNTRSSNQDVIYFMGHGNTNYWSPGLTSWDVGSLNLGSTHPFVFAASCLTGNYQDGGDYGIAEAFLERGAAVYVGSTQVSMIGTNDDASYRFFKNWEPHEPIAQIINSTKRWIWGEDGGYEFGKMWAYEYNVYGDPKFGVVSPGIAQAASAPTAAQGGASLQIHVPAYTVTDREGWDYVEIPDGDMLREPGQYIVPFWTTTVDYAAGQRVQGLTLTQRSGLVITGGLNIPTATMGVACASCVNGAARAAQDADWVPTLDKPYRWTVDENPDGTTTLVVTVYPFYYNPTTQDAQFYQEYAFDVSVITTSVKIESLTADKDTYLQGERASIDALLSNSGGEQDVIVRVAVRPAITDTLASSLPLQTLSAFSGTAALNFQWDTSGLDSGEYNIQVDVRDGDGHLLDTATQDVRLGVVAGQVTALSAAPAAFDPGQVITASLTFSNTGTTALAGTAIMQVQTADGLTVTAMFTQTFADLAPGASDQMLRAWDTSGVAVGSYRILGYAVYEGQTSEPKAVQVNTKYRVYLPVVIR